MEEKRARDKVSFVVLNQRQTLETWRSNWSNAKVITTRVPTNDQDFISFYFPNKSPTIPQKDEGMEGIILIV